ncbi:venom metalloproteinase antarease TserMP_A-like [Leptopilina boulardi]|uniref:venom metalloproteinase antarease TserMP_A-like n=1 Tax=Leptopilina boulardi TaxID=63433 RepID=UPI0021F58364|nr:venom metalloproteinase antarease TserMP_A-like [Leptopilina boulardi]
MIYLILFCAMFAQFVWSDETLTDKINGIDRNLYLNPKQGFFAGKRTKIWTAKINPNNPDKFIYSARSGVMEKVGTFYQDRKTLFSHTIDVKQRTIYKRDVELDENLNIPEKSKLGDPEIIYPEIMIFVDDALFSRFNKDVEKTVKYILAFWNGVDLRYRAFKTPEIFLNIARIILVEGPLPFEKNTSPSNDRNKIFDTRILNSFGQYLYNEDRIGFKRDYDVAILMTGKDLINENYGNFTTGISYVNGACNKSAEDYKIRAVGVIEDNGGFKGIRAGAHELAHLLGAPHDGDEGTSLGGPGAITCLPDYGFLMSYERDNRNQFYFSSCTKQSITYYTSLARAECLRDNPARKMGTYKLNRILPGKLMTLNEQCRKSGFYAPRYNDSSVCQDLWCLERPFGKKSYQSTQAAAEGSYCGNNMYCLDGSCVSETATDS